MNADALDAKNTTVPARHVKTPGQAGEPRRARKGIKHREGVRGLRPMCIVRIDLNTARRIRSWPRVLVASPDYLARAGTPRIPTDLSSHELIVGPMKGHNS
jgi:hypothetical protein